MGLRVVTGCTTREQFVSVFDRFCDAKTCFIPTAETPQVGSTLSFSLRLSDGKPILRGAGVVRRAWQNFDNVYERPGVLVEIKKLSTESEAVYEQLLAKRYAVEQTRPYSVNSEAIPTVFTNRHVRRKKAMPSAHAKPPPIPPAALRRLLARGTTAPLTLRPVAASPGAPMPWLDSTTVVAMGPVPIEALPALDSVATVVLTTPIPAEASPPAAPRVTPATVPSRRSKPTINPLAGLDDRTLDAFLDCSMSEPASADISMPGHEDTTLVGSR
ncbi:MAG: hypothetical protein H0T89_20295 [Deltaproteobacteria bacterium]|nr:hypothetical protein [Deltaproteobacteria bacterium]